MSAIFEKILKLVLVNEVVISDHGYDELADDDIYVKDIMAGVAGAVVVEEYPEYPKDPLFWFYKRIRLGIRSMRYGEFQKDFHRRPF